MRYEAVHVAYNLWLVARDFNTPDARILADAVTRTEAEVMAAALNDAERDGRISSSD